MINLYPKHIRVKIPSPVNSVSLAKITQDIYTFFQHNHRNSLIVEIEASTISSKKDFYRIVQAISQFDSVFTYIIFVCYDSSPMVTELIQSFSQTHKAMFTKDYTTAIKYIQGR